MTVTVETQDWKLRAFIDWNPKNHSENCDYCGGSGEVGGGFKSLDGPRTCPTCHGSKFVIKGPSSEKPEVPKDLVEHMRRAWWDFVHGKAPPPDAELASSQAEVERLRAVIAAAHHPTEVASCR